MSLGRRVGAQYVGSHYPVQPEFGAAKGDTTIEWQLFVQRHQCGGRNGQQSAGAACEM